MRRARPEEGAEIAHLYVASRNQAIDLIPPMVGGSQRAINWLSGLIVSGEECWVTEDDKGISGFVLLKNEWVEQLYLRPDVLHQGLGTALLNQAKLLRPNGLKLWTFQSNYIAQAFYEKNGFREILRTDGAENEEHAPDILYEWN